MNNTKTSKIPATVRELGDMVHEQSVTAPALLRMLGPTLMPPAGYTSAEKRFDVWAGPETMNRRWIITPIWNATTNTHWMELCAVNHQAPDYSKLTTAEALQLAAGLTAATQAIKASQSA